MMRLLCGISVQTLRRRWDERSERGQPNGVTNTDTVKRAFGGRCQVDLWSFRVRAGAGNFVNWTITHLLILEENDERFHKQIVSEIKKIW